MCAVGAVRYGPRNLAPSISHTGEGSREKVIAALWARHKQITGDTPASSPLASGGAASSGAAPSGAASSGP